MDVGFGTHTAHTHAHAWQGRKGGVAVWGAGQGVCDGASQQVVTAGKQVRAEVVPVEGRGIESTKGVKVPQQGRGQQQLPATPAAPARPPRPRRGGRGALGGGRCRQGHGQREGRGLRPQPRAGHTWRRAHGWSPRRHATGNQVATAGAVLRFGWGEPCRCRRRLTRFGFLGHT